MITGPALIRICYVGRRYGERRTDRHQSLTTRWRPFPILMPKPRRKNHRLFGAISCLRPKKSPVFRWENHLLLIRARSFLSTARHPSVPCPRRWGAFTALPCVAKTSSSSIRFLMRSSKKRSMPMHKESSSVRCGSARISRCSISLSAI